MPTFPDDAICEEDGIVLSLSSIQLLLLQGQKPLSSLFLLHGFTSSLRLGGLKMILLLLLLL